MAYIPASEIPNAPNVDPTMPGVEYPKIPAIRNEPIGFRVNMEGRAADLMQKPLPESFARGYAMVAEAAGKGQMAMGKAIQSGSADIASSLVTVSGIFGRLAREAEQSRDRMDYFRVKDNYQMMRDSFEAEAANKRWTPAEKVEYWPAWGQRLQEMNAGLGATPTSKDIYQAQTRSYIDSKMYGLMTESAKESLEQDQKLQEDVFRKSIDNGDTVTAAEDNETAYSLRKIPKDVYEERKWIVEKANRAKAEGEALDLDPYRLEEDTAKVMKGGESEDFPYLKQDRARARELNAAARQRINTLESEGAQTYQDKMTRGEIPFDKRDEVAKQLHVRPSEAKAINADADNPDPTYDPGAATRLDTRLTAYNPPTMPGEMTKRTEYYAIKEDIRKLPRSHRAEYEARLNDKLDAAIAGTKGANVADQLLSDTFKHLDDMDTGRADGILGDDGTNHERGEKMKIKDPAVYSAHFQKVQKIKDGLRRFVAGKPDATDSQVWDEYRRLISTVKGSPGSVEAFDKAAVKVPQPTVTGEQIKAEEKRLQENRPPTAIPQTPTGYPGVGPEPTAGAPSGYPAKQPPGTSSFAPPGTTAEGMPQGKLVPRITGAEPLPNLRLFRQRLGLEPIPRATAVERPAAGPSNQMRVTAYVPGMRGKEGKNEVKSRSGPAYTMEDYAEGKVPHVSVAMDSNSPLQGKYLKSDDPDYAGVVFKVEDTGSAFKGKGNTAIDVAFRDRGKATNYAKNTNFTPISEQEALNVAAARPPALPYRRLERQVARVEPVPGPIAVKQEFDPRHPAMNRPRQVANIKSIVVHGDVSTNVPNLIAYSKTADRGYHYYIALDGSVTQVVPDDRKAYHIQGANSDSIGIILVGADNGKMPTAAQDKAAKALISQLGRKYGIDPKNVYGHGERQPQRRHALEGGHVAKDIRERGYI